MRVSRTRYRMSSSFSNMMFMIFLLLSPVNSITTSIIPLKKDGSMINDLMRNEIAGEQMKEMTKKEVVDRYIALLSNRTKECQRLNSKKDFSDKGKCRTISDYNFGCLNATPSRKSFTYICQASLFGTNFTSVITRQCGSDNTWILSAPANEDCEYVMRVNYLNSHGIHLKYVYDILEYLETLHSSSNAASRKVEDENTDLFIAMPVVSCSFCVFGLIVLSWLYPRSHVRNNIHRLLFVSIFLWELLDLIFNQLLKKNIETLHEEQSSKKLAFDQATCHGLYFMTQFFYASTIMWLFNEGLHHFWIIFFPYNDPLKFRVFLAVSFCVSSVMTFAYLVPVTMKTGGHPACVLDPKTKLQEKAFLYFFAAVHSLNILIFIYLMVILRRKIKRENNSSAKKRWRLARSWFILLFLFGGGIFIEIESDSNNKSLLWSQRIISGLQSFFLFMTQVVFSKDVTNKLALKWRRHKQKNILPPLKSTKSPLRFLKRFKRTKQRKQPTVIYTVDSLRKNETRPEQVDHNQQGISNDGFTAADTQQTQLSSVAPTASVVETEGEIVVIKNPNIDVIEEESSVGEAPQERYLDSGDSPGVDNVGYENEETLQENSNHQKHHIGAEDSASSNDSGIEQDNSRYCN